MGAREIPEVRCTASPSGKTWSFFCNHCGHVHSHSAGEGHRVAHCPPGTGFSRTGGYYLLPPLEKVANG